MIDHTRLGLLCKLFLGLCKLAEKLIDGGRSRRQGGELVELGNNQAVLRSLQGIHAHSCRQGILAEPVGPLSSLGGLGERAILTVGGIQVDNELIVNGFGGEIRRRCRLELESGQGLVAEWGSNGFLSLGHG